MRRHLTIPHAFGRWVLSHRMSVVLAVVLFTAPAVWAIRQVPIRTGLAEMLLEDDASWQAYRQRAEQFGGSSDDLILLGTEEPSSVLAPDTLAAIAAAGREIASLPTVESVTTLANVLPLLSGGTAAGSARAPEQDDDLGELAGRLISDDQTAQAMLITLARDADLHGRDQSRLRRQIENIVRRHGLGLGGVHAAGIVVTQGWMFDEFIWSVVTLLPVGVAVCVLLVFAIFRRPVYVAITVAIALVAMTWGVGLTAAIYGQLTLLVAAAPLLVLVLSTADVIHLISAYHTELAGGASRDEALRAVFHDVGGACVLTSLTTLAGFLSLMLVPAASLRHFALATAIGVASALLLALTLVPIALSLMPPPPVGRSSEHGVANRWIDAVVSLSRRLALGRPRSVTVVLLVVLALATAAGLDLRLEPDLTGRFEHGHPLRGSTEFFNRRLHGSTVIELHLQAGSSDMFDPQLLATVAELNRRLQAEPSVRAASSIATVFHAMSGYLEFDPATRLPATKTAAVAAMQLADRVLAGASRRYVIPERGLGRLMLHVDPTGVFEVLQLAERTERLARDILPADVTVEATGTYPVIGRAAIEIIDSQFRGFVLCFASVMLLILLGTRSLRLSLLAALPNLLPLALLGGLLWLTYDAVDSDVLGVTIVSLGLAVDDTIHFLHRYDIQRATAPDARTALEQTFDYTGRAVVRTTVILGGGLLPFAWSGYFSISIFGTYLVFVLACAILGDLLLLPALILLTDRPRARQTTN